MDISETQYEALQARSMRDFGIALILLTGILGGLYLLPVPRMAKAPSVSAVPEATVQPRAFSRVDINAKAAVVLDMRTGKVLYEKNADAQLPLASLTKLLAVYAAVDTFDLAERIAVNENDAGTEPPRAFLNGDVVPLDQLARLTLTASLNDGAAALVDAVARKRGVSAAAALTSTAHKLGLNQTYAHNGSGLDLTQTVSGAYGSARDMARLAYAVAERVPTIAAATTHAYAAERVLGGQQYRVKNTNPDVGEIPQLLLSKTGFTDLAGGNLALVFDAGLDHPIAVVVMGSSKSARFTDGEALIRATRAYFANIETL